MFISFISIEEEFISIEEELISIEEEFIGIEEEFISIEEEFISIEEELISIVEELVNNRDFQPLRKIVSKQANLNIDLEDPVSTKTTTEIFTEPTSMKEL